MSVPDVSQVHNAFLTVKSWSPFERRIPEHAATPILESHEPLHSRSHATRVGRKQERKRRNCSSYLSHVAALLVGAMRHRRKIGRQSARGNRADRKKSRTGRRRGARERAASTSQHQCGEIFGGLQNSNSSASSVGVLLTCCFLGAPATTRIHNTLRDYVLLVSSSSSVLLAFIFEQSIEKPAQSLPSFPFLLSLGHQLYFALNEITSSSMISLTIRPNVFSPPER